MELKIRLSLSALLAVLFIVNKVEAQSSSPYIQNPCTSKSTCHECIQTPSCVWCYDPNFKSNVRCFRPFFPTPTSEQCPEQFVYDPDNVMRIMMDIALTVPGGHGWSYSTYGSDYEANMTEEGGFMGRRMNSDSGVITQIRPQRLGLRLRTRNRYRLRMFYTQAEDYPVDLYYLMGFSKSMENKQKLSKLGDRLAEAIPNITTNFAFGLGSLVNSIPEKSVSPCTSCAAPYGFRNYMSLNTDTNQFSSMLREASASDNLEASGGGLDAIMQAVVCRGEIGWRETARRILVFSTDADFHYHGDGKVDGVVKPNDGRCHLNSTGYYTISEKQDYPSISQINDYIKNNAINIIFAVTPDKIDACKRLQSHIEGATCGILSNDLTNIVELIKQHYEQISSTVEMKHNASSDVNIKFSTKCLNHNGALIETDKCSNIKVGDLVEFHIDLEVNKCPKNRVDWQQTIQIYPVGIDESLIIDLEMLCDCPCEHPGDVYYFENSPKCHHNNTLAGPWNMFATIPPKGHQ